MDKLGVRDVLWEGSPWAPSIQIVPTLRSKVYKYYPLWAFWSPWVLEEYCTSGTSDLPFREVRKLSGLGLFTLNPYVLL